MLQRCLKESSMRHTVLWEIYVIRTDGASLVNLTNDAGADMNPVWSPDGTRIAFVSDGISIVNADGTSLTSLAPNVTTSCVTAPNCGHYESGAPTWSQDGSEIASQFMDSLFVRDCQLGTCYRRVTGARSGISVMNPDGTQRFTVASDPFIGDGSPKWRPR
jgi:TolB protein